MADMVDMNVVAEQGVEVGITTSLLEAFAAGADTLREVQRRSFQENGRSWELESALADLREFIKTCPDMSVTLVEEGNLLHSLVVLGEDPQFTRAQRSLLLLTADTVLAYGLNELRMRGDTTNGDLPDHLAPLLDGDEELLRAFLQRLNVLTKRKDLSDAEDFGTFVYIVSRIKQMIGGVRTDRRNFRFAQIAVDNGLLDSLKQVFTRYRSNPVAWKLAQVASGMRSQLLDYKKEFIDTPLQEEQEERDKAAAAREKKKVEARQEKKAKKGRQRREEQLRAEEKLREEMKKEAERTAALENQQRAAEKLKFVQQQQAREEKRRQIQAAVDAQRAREAAEHAKKQAYLASERRHAERAKEERDRQERERQTKEEEEQAAQLAARMQALDFRQRLSLEQAKQADANQAFAERQRQEQARRADLHMKHLAAEFNNIQETEMGNALSRAGDFLPSDLLDELDFDPLEPPDYVVDDE